MWKVIQSLLLFTFLLNHSWCGLIVLLPSTSFISPSARWGLIDVNFPAAGALTCFGVALLWTFFGNHAAFDSLLLVSRVVLLVLDRNDFKDLRTRCFHADSLLPARLFLDLKISTRFPPFASRRVCFDKSLTPGQILSSPNWSLGVPHFRGHEH